MTLINLSNQTTVIIRSSKTEQKVGKQFKTRLFESKPNPT